MDIYEGKRLRPKEHLRDYDDDVAIVEYFNERLGWNITIGSGNVWYHESDIEINFEEIMEDNKDE